MVSSHGKNQLVLLHFLGGNFRVYLELRRVTRQENIMPWRLAPTLVRRLTAFSRGALGFSSRTKLGSKGKLHVSAEVSSNIYKLYQIISNYNIWYQSEWVLLFSEDNIGISCEFALLETMFWFCSDHSGWNSSKAKKTKTRFSSTSSPSAGSAGCAAACGKPQLMYWTAPADQLLEVYSNKTFHQ